MLSDEKPDWPALQEAHTRMWYEADHEDAINLSRAQIGNLLDYITRLKSELNMAYERAAKVAEASPDSHWGPTIATAIRNLKEPT
jgi:hypothetical protein